MHLVAAPEDAGKRVDLVIAHRCALARSRIAEAAASGTLHVNGAAVRGSHLVNAGDAIEIAVREPQELTVEADPIQLSIVYEDDDVLVVDKPAGMVTHPAPGATSGTLVNALLAHTALPGSGLRPGLVHRLDRDTSGLLVVAKNSEALSFLAKGMKARHISREYLGLVSGLPAQIEGTVEGPIGRDPHNRLKFAIVAGGKPAITHYELRERLQKAAELRFQLETGRTHQIRVHMAALGHPLINDPMYGRTDARFELPGQALHAWRLTFLHPSSHREMRFEVEPPPEYTAARAILAR